MNGKVALALFVIADVFCVGMGMGVPFFCILFGFPVGWILARRFCLHETRPGMLLGHVLRSAVVTSLFTFFLMLALWGPMARMLLNPATDFVNLGIPQILYEPVPSFIGWLVLMIFVSPFLQLMATVFAAYLTLAVELKEAL